jgi:hypothetical protein
MPETHMVRIFQRNVESSQGTQMGARWAVTGHGHRNAYTWLTDQYAVGTSSGGVTTGTRRAVNISEMGFSPS